MMMRIVIVFAGITLTFALTGCGKTAGVTPEPDPDPPPSPEEVLRGVWSVTYDDDDGKPVTALLSLNKSRYVLVYSIEVATNTYNTSTRSGTWNATDAAITKMRKRSNGEEVIVQKPYRWGDEQRSTLSMPPWLVDRELDAHRSITHTREAQWTPSDLAGTWVERINQADGSVAAVRFSYSEDGDCSWLDEIDWPEDSGIDDVYSLITGNCEIDFTEHFAVMTVEQAVTSTGVAHESVAVGHVLRFAFARGALHEPEQIVMSSFDVEQEFDAESGTWIDGPSVYGDYVHFLARAVPLTARR